MIFHEFGKEGEKTVLLIHGLGCNAERSFAIPSAILSRTYRVITVDLDGYDGKGSVFTTIPDQAEKIAVFLRKHCDGKPESFLHGILSWQQGEDHHQRSVYPQKAAAENENHLHRRVWSR